jgi:predicted nucleotidyltransferase
MARVIERIDVSSRPTLRSVADTIGANAQRLREAGIGRLVVFGSVVRGEDTEDSDVDVMVTPLLMKCYSTVLGLKRSGSR